MPSVFFLGATGYVGGSVLVAFRERYPSLPITALVRNPAHVDTIRSTGVAVLQGSFTDTALIEEQSYAHDIVVNTADSDDVPFVEAILRGSRRRADEGKAKSVFIHTSGVAVFLDDGKDGRFDPGAKVWNDNDEDDIKAITPDRLHGQVDFPILQAGKEGYVETYIISPAAIVGDSRGPVNNGSFFLKFVVQFYTALQRAVYVGEGSNHFTLVHIDDVVDLFLRVFELSVKPSVSTSPHARYFIATSGPVAWKTIATVVGGELARRGLLADSTPQSVALADLPPMVSFMGASERVVGERSLALGWKARPVSLEDNIERDIDAVLNVVRG
ncbi:NAD(P)-binding protein [Auriscalpium vulgare]|uniref:NAD(P)-binding protein n=1 Tax=Auriscalpium vulgare TaxID=40419 RepID=A0ACB8RAA6_9AGAM|nr:NAD(P)-binding protein [Auriscalpium vulgare]